MIGSVRLPRIPIVFDRSRFKARRQSSKLPFVPSVFRLRDKSHFRQCYFPADKFNWVSPFKKLDTDHPLSIHGEQKHEFQPSGLLFSILSNGPQRSDLLNIDNYRNSPRVFAFAGQPELHLYRIAIHFNELKSRAVHRYRNEFSLLFAVFKKQKKKKKRSCGAQ